MLKRNLLFIFTFFFFVFLVLFVVLKFEKQQDKIFFSYPKWDIYFAQEKVPIDGAHYFNKKRFDNEFTISGNSLYQFYLYIKRYPVFMPYIEEMLAQKWIPNDFKYLPIAESALREDVVSPAWAAWVWQFMPETGKQYGLIVNDFVDERYNFKKSTHAAIAYIETLYERFWNRTLVAAAYNRWENAIQEALETQKVDSYYDLYLNEETSRYVFRIVAIKYLVEWYFEKKPLIDKFIGWVYSPPETETIRVWKIDNLLDWSIENGYNYRDIKLLNPWILQNSLPEGQWEIIVLL